MRLRPLFILMLFFFNSYYFFFIFSLGTNLATFFLVLCHIPLGDIKLMTVRTFKWFFTSMLSHVDFKITPSIVLFITSRDLTYKFIFIIMCPFMIPQNPLLPENFAASLKFTLKFYNFAFIMGCKMICQVLWHLKRFSTTRIRAKMRSHRHMGSNMLSQLWIFWEIPITHSEKTSYLIHPMVNILLYLQLFI